MQSEKVQKLNEAQDAVFADKSYSPLDDKTYCNLATQDVLRRLGYDKLDLMIADHMYAYISSSKEWLRKPMADAILLVQEGTIIVAILPSIALNELHGHVNTLTPGSADFSGRWDSKTPLCMNLGRVGTCFRARGINWAFQIEPEIYALVSSL